MAARRPSGIPILNRASPQAQGLVAAYSLNDGHFKELVRGGTPILTGTRATRIAPHIGKGVDFASTQYDLAEMPVNDGVPLTLACWCILDASHVGGVFGIGGGTSPDDAEQVLASVNGEMWAVTQVNGNAQAIAPSISSGVLYHFVGVWKSSTDRNIYVDGVFVDQDTTSKVLTWSNASRMTFGNRARDLQNQSFNGIIFEGQIWNRVLSDAEIWSLYDPQTRWDLYWEPSTRVYSFSQPAVAAAGGFLPRLASWAPRERPSGIPLLNRASPQARGLIHFWPMTEGAGVSRDIVSHAHLNDTSEVTHGWAVNQDGVVFDDDGTMDPASTLDGPYDGGDITVNLWTHLDADPDQKGLFNKGTTGTFDLICWASNSENLNLGSDGDTTYVQVANINNLKDKPHMLTFRAINNGEWSIWKDADKKGSASTRATQVTAGRKWYIGSYGSHNVAVDGRIWHFGVWNRALTDNEIQSLYDPVTRWDLYQNDVWQWNIVGALAAAGITISIPSIGTPP